MNKLIKKAAFPALVVLVAAFVIWRLWFRREKFSAYTKKKCVQWGADGKCAKWECPKGFGQITSSNPDRECKLNDNTKFATMIWDGAGKTWKCPPGFKSTGTKGDRECIKIEGATFKGERDAGKKGPKEPCSSDGECKSGGCVYATQKCTWGAFKSVFPENAACFDNRECASKECRGLTRGGNKAGKCTKPTSVPKSDEGVNAKYPYWGWGKNKGLRCRNKDNTGCDTKWVGGKLKDVKPSGSGSGGKKGPKEPCSSDGECKSGGCVYATQKCTWGAFKPVFPENAACFDNRECASNECRGLTRGGNKAGKCTKPSSTPAPAPGPSSTPAPVQQFSEGWREKRCAQLDGGYVCKERNVKWNEEKNANFKGVDVSWQCCRDTKYDCNKGGLGQAVRQMGFRSSEAWNPNNGCNVDVYTALEGKELGKNAGGGIAELVTSIPIPIPGVGALGAVGQVVGQAARTTASTVSAAAQVIRGTAATNQAVKWATGVVTGTGTAAAQAGKAVAATGGMVSASGTIAATGAVAGVLSNQGGSLVEDGSGLPAFQIGSSGIGQRAYSDSVIDPDAPQGGWTNSDYVM